MVKNQHIFYKLARIYIIRSFSKVIESTLRYSNRTSNLFEV